MTEMKTLFDNTARHHSGPRKPADPLFSFLNNSSRRDVSDVRRKLELWFASFPSDGRNDLRARFRSKDDWQHHGAFLELYTHELLSGIGYSASLHPSLSEDGSGRHPDFLASRSGCSFFAECTVVVPPELKRAEQARSDQVFNTLNTIDSPDFFLEVRIRGAPRSPPPGRKLADNLQSWISSLDWDDLNRKYRSERFAELPIFPWVFDGWNLVFSPIPKSHSLRGQPDLRPVGARSEGIRELDDISPLREAVVKKGKSYGDLSRPLLLFVNDLSEFADEDDLFGALFGTTQVVATTHQDGSHELVETRANDGALRDFRGPRYTRVSGVVVTFGLAPWNTEALEPLLVPNPFAALPFPAQHWPLSQYVPDASGRNLVRRNQGTVSSYLRTPHDMPDAGSLS